jgi:hypothetical protein
VRVVRALQPFCGILEDSLERQDQEAPIEGALARLIYEFNLRGTRDRSGIDRLGFRSKQVRVAQRGTTRGVVLYYEAVR